MKPYKHQQDIIDQDPKSCGLWLGTGTGKTFLALSLAEGNTLVVATKTIRDDQVWERQLEKMSKTLDLKVVSKEEFRSSYLSLPYHYDTVILDESHTMCGLTPNTRWRHKTEIPKASQIFEACLNYITKYPPKRLYLCTATPIKNPMAVLAAGWLLGKKWNFYAWRAAFYVKLPMSGRQQVFTPKKDSKTKDRLASLVRSLGSTGRLSDFTDVPEQSHIIKHIPLTEGQKQAIKGLPMLYPDPLVLVGKKHQIEQGVLMGNEFEASQTFKTEKIEAILDLVEEYDKVLVFAKYTAQIVSIAKAMEEVNVETFTLTGATKDRRELIKNAEESKKCVVICQSQISSGFELPSFRCTVFASESWSVVDHLQSIGRNLRMNALAKNLYVYLVSGSIDKAVRESIENKNDFSERIYLNL